MSVPSTASGIVELAELGPATRLAIHVGLAACDRETRLLEEKLTFPRVRGMERRHIEQELGEWRAARAKLLEQPYPVPYRPGRSQREDAGSEADA